MTVKAFLKSAMVFPVLLLAGGCAHTGVGKTSVFCQETVQELGVYSGYSPAEIQILPLTKINAGDRGAAVIQAYVSLVDNFGSQIKGPAVFRFELYEKILTGSPEQKGKRVVVWPDADLQSPGDNNRHWQDFLRTYKFDLDFQCQKSRHYVLQVTCLCPSGKRLTSEAVLPGE